MIYLLQDQATEVILTLGQAFEVAYQIALKGKIGSRNHTSNNTSNYPSSPSNPLNSPMEPFAPSSPNINQYNHVNSKYNKSKINSTTNSLKPSSNNSSRDPSPRSNIGKPSNPGAKPITNPVQVKFLSSHGRSHSVNEIKINGNQLKLVPAPVDDINIGGVKDMKAGSRAPIALTEEL